MSRLFRAGEYRKNTSVIFPFLMMAFVGLLFVIASQSGGISFGDASLLNLIKGVSLALLAALVTALTAFSFRWGRDLGDKLPKEVPKEVIGERSNNSLVLFGAIAGSAVVSLVGLMLNTGIGFSLGETIALDTAVFGVLSGIGIHSVANALFRKSNLITDNLGVNAIGYTLSLFSLLWLALFTQIGVARVDYLIIGTAAIISANLLINFEAERLLGFKALVFSLWACGTWVYLRSTES